MHENCMCSVLYKAMVRVICLIMIQKHIEIDWYKSKRYFFSWENPTNFLGTFGTQIISGAFSGRKVRDKIHVG